MTMNDERKMEDAWPAATFVAARTRRTDANAKMSPHMAYRAAMPGNAVADFVLLATDQMVGGGG